MTRRRLLLAVLALTTPAAAEEAAATPPASAAPVPTPPAQTPPAPGQPSARPRRRRTTRKPPESLPHQGQQQVNRYGDIAPVPNRDMEGPQGNRPTERPSLSPSVIQRSLPSRGSAAEGSPSLSEDRLFNPAPGARLTVPFR